MHRKNTSCLKLKNWKKRFISGMYNIHESIVSCVGLILRLLLKGFQDVDLVNFSASSSCLWHFCRTHNICNYKTCGESLRFWNLSEGKLMNQGCAWFNCARHRRLDFSGNIYLGTVRHLNINTSTPGRRLSKENLSSYVCQPRWKSLVEICFGQIKTTFCA